MFFQNPPRAFRQLINSPIADLRKVTITWVASPDKLPTFTDHFVHKDHVDRFVKACIRLHVDPGINPHNGNKTDRAANIAVSSPDIDCYWWSTPDLQNNEDYENGAGVIDFSKSTVVWEREKEELEAAPG